VLLLLLTPRYRQAETKAGSLISALFHGTLRSEVRKGRGPLSVKVEPFHCLQLDLSSTDTSSSTSSSSSTGSSSTGRRGSAQQQQQPASLQAALQAFFSGEALEGVRGGHQLVVRASRQCAIEALPRVLTLHLKQYSYDKGRGQARRIGRYAALITTCKTVFMHTHTYDRVTAAHCMS
jgi:hypothetical protein